MAIPTCASPVSPARRVDGWPRRGSTSAMDRYNRRSPARVLPRSSQGDDFDPSDPEHNPAIKAAGRRPPAGQLGCTNVTLEQNAQPDGHRLGGSRAPWSEGGSSPGGTGLATGDRIRRPVPGLHHADHRGGRSGCGGGGRTNSRSSPTSPHADVGREGGRASSANRVLIALRGSRRRHSVRFLRLVELGASALARTSAGACRDRRGAGRRPPTATSTRLQTVNLAARIAGQAGPGQVVVEEGAVIALPAGTARFEPLFGRVTLKGIPGDIGIWLATSADVAP